MKFFIGMLSALVLVCSVSRAQDRVGVGANLHLGIPVGSTADSYTMGIGGGLWFIIPVNSPTIQLAMGGSYEGFFGKSQTETVYFADGWESVTTTTDNTGFLSLFAGPKFGKETGPYFLPALSINIYELVRIGGDIGGGVILPTGLGNTKLNFGAKFSIANLLGRESGETTISGIRFIAGVVF